MKLWWMILLFDLLVNEIFFLLLGKLVQRLDPARSFHISLSSPVCAVGQFSPVLIPETF